MSVIYGLYQLHPNREKRFLAGFNFYMKHADGGCMRNEIMTPTEEIAFTLRTLHAVATRPQDFVFEGSYVIDQQSQVRFWIGNGETWLHLVCSGRHSRTHLRRGTQRRLWKAFHDLRHQQGTEIGTYLNDALDQASRLTSQAKTVERLRALTDVAAVEETKTLERV